MLRKQTFALALASTLLLAFAAAPALAAPPEEGPASPEMVLTVLSWLSQVIGVESSTSTGEFGNVIDPNGLEASSPEGRIVIDPNGLAGDPDDPQFVSTADENPDSPSGELGGVIDPGG